jgi:cysteinyl-tRNA synthetase
MSKSKGEFLTVSLLEEKGYNPLVYRFFCLQSHYRKSLVFTYENLDNAKLAYEKLVGRVAQLAANDNKGEVSAEDFDRLKALFTATLDEDLNTSNAITALYDVLKAEVNPATKLALINDFDRVLSLDLVKSAEKLNEEKSGGDVPAEVMALVEERTAARKAKDFAKADELRDKIAALGYAVKETRQGTEITKI